MAKKEIVIFFKDNKVAYVDNVINYSVFSKVNTLEVNTEHEGYTKFDMKKIDQVIVNLLLDKVVVNSDFILLP